MQRDHHLRPAADGMTTAEWDLLYDAVVDRLRGCLCGPALAGMRATVVHVVQALDLLHAALAQERGRLQRAEAGLQAACNALAAARAELLQARAGACDAGLTGSRSVKKSNDRLVCLYVGGGARTGPVQAPKL